ncbi:MAG: hypothetical protein SOZ23_04895 [Methanosphaera sp.]|uniref:hypothetical protein n=1 Tax=Methanosphaera sp. TaxID=2666342 RepID=UPI0025CD40EE|nr:hypothetical protein [Methanosphaera sp.]MCI5867609.1 hypothetical protein [Methanosphaera sp.]MDD6534076.1 hypothetical protein [Methanosphaera sp.]MDY3956114.1 hypothetical protein [Methanosphaera sp.]
MLDLFPENDLGDYNVFISYPKDCQDYNVFIKRLSDATEAFKWTDTTDCDNYAEAIADCDVLIVLSGLWDDDREKIEEHIRYAQSFSKPIILIRPYGVEEVPDELEEVATKIIGWNTACIVEAILQSLDVEYDECIL